VAIIYEFLVRPGTAFIEKLLKFLLGQRMIPELVVATFDHHLF